VQVTIGEQPKVTYGKVTARAGAANSEGTRGGGQVVKNLVVLLNFCQETSKRKEADKASCLIYWLLFPCQMTEVKR